MGREARRVNGGYGDVIKRSSIDENIGRREERKNSEELEKRDCKRL